MPANSSSGSLPTFAAGSDEIHSYLVTSNLAPHSKSAQNSRTEGNIGTRTVTGRNSFVVRIMTSKSFVVRILQGFSC
jgi:hypothetical protein